MNEKLTTAVFNILNNPTSHAPGSEIARQLRSEVLAVLRRYPEQRVIADRYEQYPSETAALLKLELAKLLAAHPDLVDMLQGLVMRYETAVSSAPTSTQATVIGSGTVVQGTGNTVIGAGATYISNSSNSSNSSDSDVNSGKNETDADAVLRVMPEAQRLREQITEYFNLDEFQNLCWDLGIPYEELGEGGLSAKARELLGVCWRNGRMPDLLNYCRKKRPHVEWPSLS